MYEQYIIIGTGELLFKIALYIYYEKQSVQVYEYGASRMSTLEKKCKRHGIAYDSLDKNSLSSVLINERKNTLIISVSNTYIFPAEVLCKSNLCTINFHPSYLPKHPGRNPESWAIYEHDRFSGITWHFVSDKIDQGNIICQEKILITDNMTAIELMIKQYEIAYNSFISIYSMVKSSGLDSCDVIENLTRAEEIKLSSELPNNGVIEGDESPQKIYDTLRAYDYGVLKVLPELVICIDGEFRHIRRYRLCENIEKKQNCVCFELTDGKKLEIEYK